MGNSDANAFAGAFGSAGSSSHNKFGVKGSKGSGDNVSRISGRMEFLLGSG
jgi:hypothetical protein